MNFRHRLITVLTLLASALAPAPGLNADPPPVDDFTFLQLSDEHFPYDPTSAEVIRTALTSGPIRLAPFGLLSDPPSFALSTGDMTEFGEEGWPAYVAAWRNAPFPVYHQTGNHDNTWACLRHRIRQLHGANQYSFDYGGCHFLGLDSASPQDPRPTISRETLLWLDRDLKNVDPATPLFVFMHHPPGPREFAGAFDCERLFQKLTGRNVVLFLVGHGHGARKLHAGPFDGIMGGSTFGKIPGYAIITIRHSKLYAAYRVATDPEANRALLTKDVPSRFVVPHVTIASPAEGVEVAAAECPVKAVLGTESNPPVSAQALVDGEDAVPLRVMGRTAAGRLPASLLTPGSHWLRVEFKTSAGVFGGATFFRVAGATPRVVWQTFLDGSSKSTPLIDAGKAYVGADDGMLYCLDAATGNRLWTFPTRGEILTAPCRTAAGICFGSGDGRVYTVDAHGKLVWRTDLGAPVYSSPLTSHGLVFLGTNTGTFCCLSARTGHVLWRTHEPTYAIETKPFLADAKLFFGAWDQYVYAVEANTGRVVWKVKGEASATKPASRYYSPADCGPVVLAGKVYIPDRGYLLSVIDESTGQRLTPVASVAGVSLAPDGTGVLLKKTHAVAKLSSDGRVVWETEVPAGYLATTVAGEGKRLYLVSDRGLLSCLDADSGRLVYQIQVTPHLWTMATPAVHDGTVYLSAMDGSVTALR